MAAFVAGDVTSFSDVPQEGSGYRAFYHVGPRTEYKVDGPRNYKGVNRADGTSGHIDLGATATQPIQVNSAVAEQSELPMNRVKGVVDRVDKTLSGVTFLYGNRENSFLLPTAELESAGAACVGALFEVIVAKEGSYTGYTVVHLETEENEARRNLSSADLSFLDE